MGIFKSIDKIKAKTNYFAKIDKNCKAMKLPEHKYMSLIVNHAEYIMIVSAGLSDESELLITLPKGSSEELVYAVSEMIYSMIHEKGIQIINNIKNSNNDGTILSPANQIGPIIHLSASPNKTIYINQTKTTYYHLFPITTDTGVTSSDSNENIHAKVTKAWNKEIKPGHLNQALIDICHH